MRAPWADAAAVGVGATDVTGVGATVVTGELAGMAGDGGAVAVGIGLGLGLGLGLTVAVGVTACDMDAEAAGFSPVASNGASGRTAEATKPMVLPAITAATPVKVTDSACRRARVIVPRHPVVGRRGCAGWATRVSLSVRDNDGDSPE